MSMAKNLRRREPMLASRLNLLWSAPGACIAWIEVREWGNNGWSPWPYTLRAWWEPLR